MIILKSFCRLARFGLTTANANQLARFYESAFGCRLIGAEHLGGPDFEDMMNVQGGAQYIKLSLGQETVELTQFDNPGRAYPVHSAASDPIFQHFAIVVSDMTKAFQRLCAVEGWSSITKGGPQRLPDASGGVTAFKFRDPERHPLELLEFPAGNTPAKWRTENNGDVCLGIDHSAIVVADSVISCAFYENLGFRVSGRSLNRGAEQERLDDVPGVHAEVTALLPTGNGPHVELLCYHPLMHATSIAQRSNDIAATRLILELPKASPTSGPLSVSDPDGHHLTIVPVT